VEKRFECVYGLGECVVAPRIIEVIKSAAKKGILDSAKTIAPDIARASKPFTEWVLHSPEAFLVQMLPHYCLACPVAKKAIMG